MWRCTRDRKYRQNEGIETQGRKDVDGEGTEGLGKQTGSLDEAVEWSGTTSVDLLGLAKRRKERYGHTTEPCHCVIK